MSNERSLKSNKKLGNYEIIEAAKNGEIHKVYDLYKRGLYPKDAILIGISIEIPENGSIGAGARYYFRNLSNTDASKKHKKTILPIPLNSFYLSRIGEYNSKSEMISELNKLVKKDIENLDGIVIPGDIFNIPPIKESKNPYEQILNYNGTKEIHDEMTIYGLNSKEFYNKFPEHKLNPNAESLHYEATLVKQVQNTDKVVMTSCHGTQVYAITAGAKMLAGIEGHDHKKPIATIVKPNTMSYGYLGNIENTALHIHKLSLNPDGMPKGLEVVGTCGKSVEIIEETNNHKPYYGFQSHPEFVKNHPALENFASAIIQRNIKKQLIDKINNKERNVNISLSKMDF